MFLLPLIFPDTVVNVGFHRSLDKIAKQILVYENKMVRTWDGSVGEYKNYLCKKMSSVGAV